jgi:rhamnosyltransferase|tara:strand:- start:1867 stop:2670 length:804 start_codon:yes stop_codon:yes gene_type:complete
MNELQTLKNLSLGFVLFNPSDLFINRLTEIASLKIDIYIFDNSPKPLLKLNKISDNIHVISSIGNLGLGKGLNSLGKYAYSKNKDALLYFDQDTLFNKHSINFINDYFLNNRELFNSLASLFFTNRNKSNSSRYVLMPHHSGMLFNIQNLKKVGWHNANIFLDVLDYDYCFEVRRKNLKILEISNTPGIDHQSNQDADLIPLFNKTFNLSRVYSKERVYDTIIKTAKLGLRSLRSLDFLYFLYLLRFLAVYSFFQIYARICSKFLPK